MGEVGQQSFHRGRQVVVAAGARRAAGCQAAVVRRRGRWMAMAGEPVGGGERGVEAVRRVLRHFRGPQAKQAPPATLELIPRLEYLLVLAEVKEIKVIF